MILCSPDIATTRPTDLVTTRVSQTNICDLCRGWDDLEGLQSCCLSKRPACCGHRKGQKDLALSNVSQYLTSHNMRGASWTHLDGATAIETIWIVGIDCLSVGMCATCMVGGDGAAGTIVHRHKGRYGWLFEIALHTLRSLHVVDHL